MPSTVNVNMRSVVHASSVGISNAFPDPCLTPAPPGPPVPIPYPNIAMSSDTQGTSTVKADGASCMIKGSSFMQSSGDEAGVAMGVVSGMIKGQAQFAMYSFDVKIEGGNACRLTDPMQQNMSSANALGPAEMQAMIMGAGGRDGPRFQACRRVVKQENKQDKKGGAAAAWDGSGVIPEHQGPIQEVVTSQGLKLLIRATKKVCAKWIKQKYQPKPHDIIEGTTLKTAADAYVWLAPNWEKRSKEPNVGTFDKKNAGSPFHTYATATPKGVYVGDYATAVGQIEAACLEFVGIVGSTGDDDWGKPFLANQKQGLFVKSNSYVNKYVTGDYDLQDVLVDRDPDCARLLQTGASFGLFQMTVNKKMKWDGIQHGPQAQWVAQEGEDHAIASFSMPQKVKSWLRSPRDTPISKVPIAKGRELAIIEDKLTVVTPQGASTLDGTTRTHDYLVCCGCTKPAPVKH
jgi:hypothetical protein